MIDESERERPSGASSATDGVVEESDDDVVDGPDAGPANVGTGVVPVNDRQVAYRRAGTDGSAIVLLHGAGVDDSALSWSHALPELGRDHRVYALDWPGHGESDDAQVHSVDAYHEVLETFLDELGLDRVALAGISMGGGVALSFALQSPERVRRLALVSSYGLGPTMPAGSMWYALANVPGANQAGYTAMGTSRAAARTGLSQVVHDASALDDGFVEAFRERASRRGAGAAFAAFQRHEIGPSGRVRTNLAPALDSLSMSTLFVHGQEDPLFPVELARNAVERVPDGRLVELAACGHWPTVEYPERVIAEFDSFFEG